MEKTLVDYDEEFDDLFVYSQTNAKYTVNIGDFVLDIGTAGNIVGIEILNATATVNAFAPVKLSKNALKNLKTAKIVTRKAGNAVYIALLLYIEDEKVPINIVAPAIKVA